MLKKMYFLIGLFLIALGIDSNAQSCNSPNNISVTATNYHSITVRWQAPTNTTQPSRLVLFNQADMVTNPGVGANGADNSSLYALQDSYGEEANYPSSYLADDFTINATANVSSMDFYAFVQDSSINSSPINKVFVAIYASQPVDSTSIPCWESDNCFSTSYWSGIYRVANSTSMGTNRPIYKVRANINTILPAGTYWVVVSFFTSGGVAVGVPRVDLNNVQTGNAMKNTNGVWSAWEDHLSLEQMGMPFTVYGTFTTDNLLGFNIFRNNAQINTDTVETFYYVDDSLMANTNYCYSVQAVYSSCLSTRTSDTCLITPVNPCIITSLPYYESFDTYGTSFPTCWDRNSTASNYGVCDVYTYTYNSSPASLHLMANTTSQIALAVSPQIDTSISINNIVARFNYNFNYSSSKLVVGVMSNPLDMTTFFPVDTLSSTSTNAWNEYFVDFAGTNENGHYIALKTQEGIRSNLFVDDFVLYDKSCMFPTSINVSVDSTSAIISWHSYSNISPYIVKYKTSDENTWTVINNLADTFLVINGLTPGTSYEYDINIGVSCGTDFLKKTVSFTCNCLTQNVPYYQDFDSYNNIGSVSNYSLASCWTKYSTSTGEASKYPYVDSYYLINSYSTSSYLYFYCKNTDIYSNSYAILPSFNVPLNSLQFECMSRAGTSNGKVYIGIINDLNNIVGSYTIIDSIISTNTTYAKHVTSFVNYSGGSGRIAVMMPKPATGTNQLYMDNVLISPITFCLAPENLHQSGGSSNSITCTWNSNNYSQGSYTLAYKQASENVWMEIQNIVDTSYTITNLLENTSYDVKIKGMCGSDMSSIYGFSKTFSTLCGSISQIPLFENFDSISVNGFPSCWLRPDCYYSYNKSYPLVSTFKYYSAPNSIAFMASKSWAATPAISSDIHSLAVNFWAYKTGLDSIQVGVMSNPLDTSTFELVSTVAPQTNATWEFFEIYLNGTSLSGNNRHVTLRLKTNSNNRNFYIDDFDVMTIPSCARPTNIHFTDTTNNSVVVHWDNNNANSWVVQYKSIYDTSFTFSDTVIASLDTLVGLVASCHYYIRVKALCDGNDGQWSCIKFLSMPCGDITDLPYQENFDVYSVGTLNSYPTCWNNLQSISYGIDNYISNSTSYSAPGALYMDAEVWDENDNGVYGLAILPKINEAIPMASLQLSFELKQPYSDSKVVIGFMSNPNSLSTFTPYDTIHTSASNTWEEKIIDLSHYTGSSRYIAFKSGMDVDDFSDVNTIYIDNVVLNYAQTCFKPSPVTINNVSHHALNISWTSNGNESSWGLAYKEASSTLWIEYPSTLNDTFLLLQGLHEGTFYDIKVRALCDSEEVSEYSNMTQAQTLCATISQLPYYQSFDSDGTENEAFPSCWIPYHSSTNQSFITSSFYHSSPGSLYMQDYLYPTAIMPQLDSSIDVKTLKLKFNTHFYSYSSSYSSYTLIVGIMDNPYDLTTFTPVSSITIPSGADETWGSDSAYFFPYTGNGRFIAFMAGHFSPNPIYLDDVILEEAESCVHPVSVTALNIASSGATISWLSLPAANTWEYAIVTSGGSLDSIIPEITYNDTLSLTDLQPSTAYDFYVRNICNDGNTSSWSQVFSFSTACAAITEFPYIEDFDRYSTGTSAYPSCWSNILSSSSSLFISDYPFNGIGALKFLLGYSITSSEYVYAIMPEIGVPINQLQLSFIGYLSTNASIDVGVMSDPTDTSTFTLIATFPYRTMAWNSFSTQFSSYQGAGKYIAFRVSNLLHATISIDHLIVDYAVTCPNPINPTVNHATLSSAEVSWTPGHDETEWEIICGESGFNPNVPVGTTSLLMYQDTVTLANLNSSTYYDVYVRALCDSNEHSSWSSVTSFRTSCDAIDTFPYSENFDSYGIGISAFPTCWERNTTYSSVVKFPYITNTHQIDLGSLYFYSPSTKYNIASLPPIDTSIDIHSLELLFSLYKSSVSNNIIVGIMSNPYDESSFEAVATISPSLMNTWEQFDIALSQYTGSGRYIAFMSDSRNHDYPNDISLDDVTLRQSPSCHEPLAFRDSLVVGNQVTLMWEPRGNASNWQISYGPIGFNPDSVNATIVAATTYPFTISNLAEGASYDMYIRSTCSSTDHSVWVGPIRVATFCVTPFELPFSENFDSYSGTNYLTQGNVPYCWYSYSDRPSVPAPHILSSGQYHYYNSGLNSIGLTANDMQHDYVVLPSFSQPLNSLKMKFWKQMSDIYGTLCVGYVSNQTDLSTFVPVDTISNSIVGTADSLDFSALQNIPLNGYIAIYWTFTSPSSWYPLNNNSCCLDDILITTNIIDTCGVPTHLSISNVTHNTATVSWSPGDDETLWVLEYKSTTSVDFIQISCMDTLFTLTDLTPNSTYDVRVKAICNINDESSFTDILSFTTITIPVNTYTITASCGEHGSVTPLGVQIVAENSDQTFSIVPDENYFLHELFVDNVSVDTTSSYTFFNIVANHTIFADFAPNAIEDYSLSSLVSIYPNPSSNYIELHILKSDLQIHSAEIVDITGKRISIPYSFYDSRLIRLNVNSIASGIYFIRLYSNDGVIIKKFIRK